MRKNTNAKISRKIRNKHSFFFWNNAPVCENLLFIFKQFKGFALPLKRWHSSIIAAKCRYLEVEYNRMKDNLKNSTHEELLQTIENLVAFTQYNEGDNLHILLNFI